MNFQPISRANRKLFYEMMVRYFRENEQEETPIDDLEMYIGQLYGMLTCGSIQGRIAYTPEAAGFVLWKVDAADSVSAQLPGYGCILEIGVNPEARNKGAGRAMAAFAEAELLAAGAQGVYVCAEGPVQDFWRKRGYAESDRMTRSGQKIFIRQY